MKKRTRVKVFCDKPGNIRSVAILNPDLPGRFHVEIEGAGPVHDLELDPDTMEPEALMGRKGAEAQKAAYETLRRMI